MVLFRSQTAFTGVQRVNHGRIHSIQNPGMLHVVVEAPVKPARIHVVFPEDIQIHPGRRPVDAVGPVFLICISVGVMHINQYGLHLLHRDQVFRLGIPVHAGSQQGQSRQAKEK